jgi:predicted AlkP superfamily pyrophosphatase or phosphodiesterase
MRKFLLLLFSFLTGFGMAQSDKSTKLVVGIVIDQMCYEYLYRYQAHFGNEGFKRLMYNGTHCRNTNYNYIPTFTGPGHASIYTGTTPSNHGIVANEWYDRGFGKLVNCVGDSTVQTVGSSSAYGKYSPHNLKTLTVTDQLKMTYPQAKVISMSIKNRGAILPGGHLSDGSFWFDYQDGKMISSSFFTEELPVWVEQFNALQYPQKACKMTWDLQMAPHAYTASGPDDSPYEHLLPTKTKPTFPYDLNTICGGVPNYDVFTHTPFANTYLTDFAIQALKNGDLGRDAQTDMLCISYSTPDIAGHSFGPQSVEIEDMYLRLDQELARLLHALDEAYGKDYVLFLTADHAVVPVPQLLMDHHMPGGYFFLKEHLTSLREASVEHFGADLILAEANLNIYLNHPLMESMKLDVQEVQAYFRDIVQQWSGVKRAFTASELYHSTMDDEWMDMMRKGYHHAESGDVLFMLEPGYLDKEIDSESARKGTSHGSAFSYDTHVPLLWYGKDIAAQEVYRNVDITDITATLVHLLNLQNPGALTGHPIEEVLRSK